MVTAFRQVISSEGAGALLTGLGPTVVGYAIQGAFKFGGYVLVFSEPSVPSLPCVPKHAQY